MNYSEMLQEMLDNEVKYIKVPATILYGEVCKLVFPYGEVLYKEENEYEWDFIGRGYSLFTKRYKSLNESFELLKEIYLFFRDGDELYPELKIKLNNFIEKYSLIEVND